MIEKLTNKIKRIGFKNEVDYQYVQLAKKVMKEGVYREGRNGGTYSIFGHQCRFDLSEGLPIITLKKTLLKPIIHELVWFLKGDTSPKYLQDNNVKIWDLWVDSSGDLPYTYPHQWRKFSNPHGKPVDQIANAIEMLKKEPNSRRIIVSAWNPAETDIAALPWCHTLFQFYVSGGKLSCQLYQRSSDFSLSWSYNVTCYSILTHIVAHLSGLEVGEFIWTGGDIHVYADQVEALNKQIKLKKTYKLPTLKINPELKHIDDVEFDDIQVTGYESGPFIKIPVSK